MSSIYKIISTGNRILADQTFCEQHYPNDWEYEGDEVIPEPPVVVQPYEWFIDVGPFYDRLGANKMAVLTSSDVGIKAIIADVQIRKWIDLKRQDVADSLAYIGSKIPTLTPEMQTAILTNSVTTEENLALRKLYF